MRVCGGRRSANNIVATQQFVISAVPPRAVPSYLWNADGVARRGMRIVGQGSFDLVSVKGRVRHDCKFVSNGVT